MSIQTKRIVGYTVYLDDDSYRSKVTVERENIREIKMAWKYYDDESLALFDYRNIKNFSGVKNFVHKSTNSMWSIKLNANN